MARRILIVIDHEPFIPPFMVTAISCSNNRYDEIYHVNTKEPTNSRVFSSDEHVHFCFPSLFERIISAFFSFFRFLFSTCFADCISCIKNNGFKWSSIRPYILEQATLGCINPLARRIIRNNQESQITVLSTWFAVSAFSAALLKKDYQRIKAVSLAHSYEILTVRNPNIPYMHIDFKHKYLDGVFFISHIIRQMYLDGVELSCKEYYNKTHVCYLGSFKDRPGLNKTDSVIFNICTCSRVIPLKRLDVLISALAEWHEGKVRWVHLGDGPLLDSLANSAALIQKRNPSVEIVFQGRMTNAQVKEYYLKEPVDVFVNLSEIEGLPISIMEAISYGIPIIATNVGGTSEVVNDSFGFLIDGEVCPLRVRKMLERFRALPKDRVDTMRQNSYEFWKSNFNAEKNIPILFDKIDSL